MGTELQTVLARDGLTGRQSPPVYGDRVRPIHPKAFS
jgi:hypothetical protein